MGFEIMEQDDGDGAFAELEIAVGADVGVSPARARAIRRQRAVDMMKRRIEVLQRLSFKNNPHARRGLQQIVEAVDRAYRAAKSGSRRR